MAAQSFKLYNKYTKEELLAMAKLIEVNEENHETDKKSIYKFKPDARKRLDEIAQAITWHMEDARNLSNNPVAVSGYTGRKTNATHNR